MNSDNFDLAKSMEPQSVDAYSSYSDKQFNNINDINNGVYANNSGLTQVQFDLSSIYNSGGFTNTTDMFLTIPIVMTATYVQSTGATVALPASSLGLAAEASSGGCAGYSLCTLKTNYQHLIHQIEVQADGKTIHETQPFTNVIQHFRMLSQMSSTDLNTWGPSLNFNQVLDNEKSVTFNKVPIPLPAATTILPIVNSGFQTVQGTGLINNIPYLPTSGSDFQSSASNFQDTGCVNTALSRRISRFADVSTADAGSATNIYGTGTTTNLRIMSATQLANEFKPTFSYVGNVLYWQDVAIIPMKYLCDVFDKIGLVRKLSAVMRIYLNTGSISVPVTNATLSNQAFGIPLNSTFANTCPFTINNVIGRTLGTAGATGAGTNAASVPLGTVAICAGVFVARAPTTAIPSNGGSINIGLNVPSHPLPSCRAYYSLCKLTPSKEEMYVTQNRNKLVVYEQLITNQYNNIGSGSSFAQLVQSGIRNPIAIVIVPLIASAQVTSLGGSTPFGFSQYGSPLDTCPATFAPLSLTNLSVTLGGNQVLNTTLFYTFENFLEQVAMADNLTSSDLGLGAGLISQSWWERNRVYYVDLKRGREADKMQTRNLQISFNNNNNVAIDLLVFTLYLDKLVIDVEAGLIKKA